MNPKLKKILGKTDDIIVRYPLVLTLAFIAAVSSVVAINLDYETNQFLATKLAFTGCLGISLLFGIKMLSQRIGKEFILEIIGILFLVFFYFYLPDSEKKFTENYAFVIIPVYILSHLFVSFSGFLNKKSEINFWQFNKNLFINIFLTVIFTGVLVGGVMLAVLAVDKLFDINFDYRIYPKTLLFLSIFGSSFIFLLFTDRGLQQLEKDDNYPQILKFFTQFILIPLLLIYTIILYFYSAKILINWELPRGWVTYLVLAYSIVGILALLLVHPLKDYAAKSWVKIFSKIFYFTLIPLLVLLFVAIFTRILEYGYTEPRYYVLLLALWLTTVVLYFVFFKNQNIKFIPISLFIFGTFALVFPYLNSFSVSKRSQKKELEKVLKMNHLLVNGKIDFQKKISSKLADEVSDKIAFLSIRKEQEFIYQFLDEKAKSKISKDNKNKYEYDILNNARSLFTNVDYSIHNKIEFNRLELIADNNFKNIDGYSYICRLRNLNEEGVKLNNDTFYLKNKLFEDNKEFSILLNSTEKADLMPQILKLLHNNQNGRIEVPEISLETDLGKYRVKILFENMVREKVSPEKENIYFNDALILIKER